jgi:site-specific recombinase XerD
VANYLADLRAFLRWSEKEHGPGCSPLDLGAPDVEAFCTYLEEDKGQAPTTINRRIQALRKFYTLAVDEGWSDCNPAEPISLRKERVSKRSRSLTPQDVDRLLRAVRGGRPNRVARDLVVIHLLVSAGLKLGELTQLRLEDLHLDASEPHMRVRPVNSGPAREVPLEGELYEALVDYLECREAVPGVTHVCLNRDGRPLSRRSIQRILRRYAKAARLDSLTTQALRFVYAQRLYARSGDLKIVARRLGHRHLATTIRYLRSGSKT